MSREWTDKTCEVCEYRVDELCRLHPPSNHIGEEMLCSDESPCRAYYPLVYDTELDYGHACAQYREIGHEDDEINFKG